VTVQTAKLGDLATVVMGQSPKGGSYNTQGVGTPLLNGPTEFGPVHPTEKQWTTESTKLCEPEDVLFCVRGATAGRLNVADKEYCIGRGLAAIRGKQGKFDTGFLRHVLANGYAAFQARGVGSTFINISGQELSNFEVPAIKLAEQRKISAILDKAEALRAKRRTAFGHADRLIQSLFMQFFGDLVSSPGTWQRKPLGSILDFLTSGSRGWAAYYRDSGSLFLRIQNVGRDELRLDDVAFVDAPQTAESRRTRVEAGDVLLSITADLGRTAVVPEGLGNAYINQHLSILRTSAVLPRFLSAFLTSPSGQRQILRRNKQAVKAGLNFDDIRSVEIPMPPPSLQKKFVETVQAAERVKEQHRSSSEHLDFLFDSLQHRAFLGEL